MCGCFMENPAKVIPPHHFTRFSGADGSQAEEWPNWLIYPDHKSMITLGVWCVRGGQGSDLSDRGILRGFDCSRGCGEGALPPNKGG
jgi:hypothetical protein